MPIIIQTEYYTREQVEKETDKIFVFGDNEERRGTGGQAKACRGLPNTIGVRTKAKASHDEDAYWHDDMIIDKLPLVQADFRDIHTALLAGKTVVFPVDGLGTGLAKLSENAPFILSRIQLYTEWLCENWETTYV